MFIDACALIAVLWKSRKPKGSPMPFLGDEKVTSPFADSRDLPRSSPTRQVWDFCGRRRGDRHGFLEARGIELRDLPPAKRATKLALTPNNYGKADTALISAIVSITPARNITGSPSSRPMTNFPQRISKRYLSAVVSGIHVIPLDMRCESGSIHSKPSRWM